MRSATFTLLLILFVGCSSDVQKEPEVVADPVPVKVLVPARIEVRLMRSQSLVGAESSVLELSQRMLSLAGVETVESELTSFGVHYQIQLKDADLAEGTLGSLETWLAEVPGVSPDPFQDADFNTIRTPVGESFTVIPFVPGRSRTILPRDEGVGGQDIQGLAAALRELPEIAHVVVEGAWVSHLIVKTDRRRLAQHGLSMDSLKPLVEPALAKWNPGDDLESLNSMVVLGEGPILLADIARIERIKWHAGVRLPDFDDGVVHVLQVPGASWKDLETQLQELMPRFGYRVGFKLFDECDRNRSIVATFGGADGTGRRGLVGSYQSLFERHVDRDALGADSLTRIRNWHSLGALTPGIDMTVLWPEQAQSLPAEFARNLAKVIDMQPGFYPLGIGIRGSSQRTRRRGITFLSDDLDQLVRIERATQTALERIDGLQLVHVLTPLLGPQQLELRFRDQDLIDRGFNPGSVEIWLASEAKRVSSKVKIMLGVTERIAPDTPGESFTHMTLPRPWPGSHGLENLLDLPMRGKKGNPLVRDLAQVTLFPGLLQISYVGTKRGFRIQYDIEPQANEQRVDELVQKSLAAIELPPDTLLSYHIPPVPVTSSRKAPGMRIRTPER